MLIALLQAFILAETDILPYFYWPIDFIEVIHLSVKEHFFSGMQMWNVQPERACPCMRSMSLWAVPCVVTSLRFRALFVDTEPSQTSRPVLIPWRLQMALRKRAVGWGWQAWCQSDFMHGFSHSSGAWSARSRSSPAGGTLGPELHSWPGHMMITGGEVVVYVCVDMNYRESKTKREKRKRQEQL